MVDRSTKILALQVMGHRRRAAGGFTLMELLVVIVIVAALAALVVTNVGRTTDDAELVASRATMQTVAEAFTGSAAGPGYFGDMKYVPGFRGTEARNIDGSARVVRVHDLLVRGKELVPQSLQPEFDPVSQRGWRGPYLQNVVAARNTKVAGRFPAPDDVRFEGDKSFQDRFFFDPAKNQNFESGYVVGTDVLGDLVVGDAWGNPIILQVPTISTDLAECFRFARLVSAGPDGELDTLLDNATAAVRDDDLVQFLNRADDRDEP